MLGDLTQLILEGIKSHGILAVILGVVIETIIVPLPSPLIVMAAGYILIPQGSFFNVLFNALWISLVAGIAQTIGSYLVYGFAFWLGKPFIQNYEKFHGVSWTDITEFEKKFRKGKKEEWTLFFLRALPIMPLSVVSGVAGVMKMDFKKYTFATFLGVIPRNFVLAILGFAFGGFYHVIAQKIDFAETLMTIILLLLIIAYIFGKRTGFIEKIRKRALK